MLREAASELSSTVWRMVSLIAMAGSVVMAFAFVADHVGLEGETFWMAMTVVVPVGLLVAMGSVLVKLSADADSPPVDPALYVVAGNAFLTAEESAHDDRHYIETTEQHVDLTNGAESVVLTERYEGRNVRTAPSEGFRIYAASETFIDDTVTITQILEGGEREQLDVVKVNQDDPFVSTYEAKFVEPIGQNEPFELEIESDLGSWDLSNGQVLFFDFNRFERGVGGAKCSFAVDTPPETVSAYRAVNHTDMTHHRDPAKLDFELEEMNFHSDASDREFWVDGRDLRDHVFLLTFDW